MKRTWAAYAALIATGILIAGCTTTAENKAPTASMTVGNYVLFVGGSVTFNGSASKDPDGKVKSFIWAFGDGSADQTVTAKDITHTFTKAGAFTVSLFVKDDKGLKSKKAATEVVVVAPLPTSTTSVTDTLSNITFQVDNSSLGGRITDYSWDFGDGTSVGKGPTVTHQYLDNGNYTVALTVNYKGAAISSLNVKIQDRPPVANISIGTATPHYSNMPISFVGAASGDPDGTIQKWYWEFSDSTTDNGTTVTHIFAMPGEYTVKLTVTDNDNGTGVATMPITIVQDLMVTNVSITPYHDNNNLSRANLTVKFDNPGDAKAAGTINITVKAYQSDKTTFIDSKSKVFDAPVASKTVGATATITELLISNIDPATTQYWVEMSYNGSVIDSGWYPK